MSVQPKKFAHVVYRTRRFDEMLKWYTAVFDAKVQYANPVVAFLTYDDEHHRFAFANMSLIQPEGTETDKLGVIGVDHVAYTYASLGDLFENYATLKERRIAPYWCIHHGITVSMYYADPDGNQMEFQVDAFKTNEEANAFMHDRFAANPIGLSSTRTPGCSACAQEPRTRNSSPGQVICRYRPFAALRWRYNPSAPAGV